MLSKSFSSEMKSMLVRSKDIGYYTHLFLLMELLIKSAVISTGDKNIPRKSLFSFSLIRIKVLPVFFLEIEYEKERRKLPSLM